MTTFTIQNSTANEIQIDTIMVYNSGWHEAAREGAPVKNDINSGFHLVSAPLKIAANGSVDIKTMFNTYVLYKNGLSSDSAFLLFGVRQSNLHVGLSGEFLRNTGIYGDKPGAVTWEYNPSEPHLTQTIRITKVGAS